MRRGLNSNRYFFKIDLVHRLTNVIFGNNIKLAKEVIDVLDKIFSRVKETIKAIKNLFPIKVGTLNGFLELVKENGNPIEIKPGCDIEMSSANPMDSNNSLPMVTGRRYIVHLVSKTKEGRRIVYDRFCGFLFAMSEYKDEQRLFRKTREQAKIILGAVNRLCPKVSAKIVEA